MGLNPAPITLTFLQAPLRSRTVRFPQSGSDLGFPSRILPVATKLKCWRTYTPSALVYPQTRPRFEGRLLSALRPSRPPWDRQVPRAPSPHLGVTSMREISHTSWQSVTPASSLLRTHAPNLCPAPASGCPSCERSLQVAASPCCAKALPGVVSANPSLRAWTPTPAAPVVHVPVTSHETTAFPEL
jgi:hypothetical protein